MVLPCSACTMHMALYLRSHPPSAEPADTPNLEEWMVRFHNDVNARLGRPEVTVQAARAERIGWSPGQLRDAYAEILWSVVFTCNTASKVRHLQTFLGMYRTDAVGCCTPDVPRLTEPEGDTPPSVHLFRQLYPWWRTCTGVSASDIVEHYIREDRRDSFMVGLDETENPGISGPILCVLVALFLGVLIAGLLLILRRIPSNDKCSSAK